MLKASHINHKYGKDQVLYDISMKINSNEFVAISGDSGSGKSTLLSIISTLLKPSSGDIFFDDINSKDIKNIDDFRNTNIGFIFQFHYLLNHLSVFENIKLVGKNPKSKILNILDKLGIQNLAHRYPDEISGGQRQRVAVARAIINDPKYIFADEPTGSLDSKNSIAVYELLKNLNATVIIATHEKDMLQRADRIITLKDGAIN